MTSNIFTYGTLIISSVFEAVAQRSFDSSDAYLDGYSRFSMSGRTYPGIIETLDGLVDGRVYFNLDQEALDRLSYFEDDVYFQKEVSVTLDNESIVQTLVYVVPPEKADCLSDQPWSLKKFREEHLGSYLKNTRSYMSKYRKTV